jgi:dihydrofolate reductase (trimethoprim resistance protein)
MIGQSEFMTEQDRCWPSTHRRFKYGDCVEKTSGSEWLGRIVGWYSTKLTSEGYAVESEYHDGSVQIYPVAALRKIA